MGFGALSKWVVVVASTGLVLAGLAAAQDTERPFAGHVVYGRMAVANDDPGLEGDDYDFTIFGVDVQKPFNQGILKYGFETGALFSLDSSLRRFSAASGGGGGAASISVDIRSFLMDFFGGGYVALEPAGWLRVYAGAGPLLIWGFREVEPAEPLPEPYTEESEAGLGVGVYGRAGIDILFTDYLGLTAGARITRTTLNFDDTAGDVDVEGWQYYAGLAFHF